MIPILAMAGLFIFGGLMGFLFALAWFDPPEARR